MQRNYIKILGWFNNYSFGDCLLLRKAINEDFKVITSGNTLLSTDWGESHNIYKQALQMIQEELFSHGYSSASDLGVFPDAIKFIEDIMGNHHPYPKNAHGILLYTLDNRIKMFS